MEKKEPKPEPTAEEEDKEVVEKPVVARHCKRCGCKLRRGNNGTLCWPCGGGGGLLGSKIGER
jgi:hypothetical protein